MSSTPTTPQLIVNQKALLRFLIPAVLLATTLLAIPVAIGQDFSLFLLINQYLIMLGGGIWLARRAGPGGVRRLFSGLAHWRIGVGNWALAVLAMPVATIGVAMVTGTYVSPDQGWLALATDYLYTTFVYGALLINLAEETFWQGLVQRSLASRHGRSRAALLTAIPFTILHIPIALAGVTSWTQAAIFLGVLLLVAPTMRFVLGEIDLSTGGSLLAVVVFHAAFNASGKLTVVDGLWQYAVGLGVIAALLLIGRVWFRRQPARDQARETGAKNSSVTAPASAHRTSKATG